MLRAACPAVASDAGLGRAAKSSGLCSLPSRNRACEGSTVVKEPPGFKGWALGRMVPHATTTPLLPPAPGSSSGALTKRVTLESLGAGNDRSEQRSTSGERGSLPSRVQRPSPTKHKGLLCPWSSNPWWGGGGWWWQI